MVLVLALQVGGVGGTEVGIQASKFLMLVNAMIKTFVCVLFC